MIVLDASALIAWLDSTDALHERARAALVEVAAEPLGASTPTLAEVLVGPVRAGRSQAAHAELSDLGLSEIGLEGATGALAALRVETGARLPDCCVLAAARLGGAGSVLTFDRRLAATARRLGHEVVGDPE